MTVRFGVRSLGAAASLGLTLALIGAAASSQAKESSPPAAPQTPVTTYIAAADALLADMGDTTKKTTLPKKSAPLVKAFHDQTARLLPILGTPKAPLTDLSEAASVCGKSAKVLANYSIVGAALAITQGMTPQQASEAVAKVQSKNISDYFDELYPEFIFSYHCQAVMVPMMDKYFSTLPPAQVTPQQQQGVVQARNGAMNEQQGIIMVAASPELGEPRRTEILRLMSEDGRRYAILLTKAERDQLVKLADQLEPKLTTNAQRHWLQDYTAAMSTAECPKLCTL